MGENNLVSENDVLTSDENASENKDTQPLGAEEVEIEAEPECDELDYGEYNTIWVAVDYETGYIKVTVNNHTYTGDDTEWGYFYVGIDELLIPGEYPVEVEYIDEENDLYGYTTTSFIVNKVSSSMKITNVDENFNVYGVLKVNNNPMGGETIFYTIDGGDRLNTTTDENGIFSIKAGENDNIIMFYFDDNNITYGSTAGIALKPLILYVGELTSFSPDGSFDNPYPSLIDAWKFVDSQNFTAKTDIIIYFKDGVYVYDSEEVNEVIDNSKYHNGFVLNKNMNVTISAINSSAVDFKFNCDKFIFDLLNEDFVSLTYSGINFIFDDSDIFLGVGYRRLPRYDLTVGDLVYNNCSFVNFSLGFTEIGSMTSTRTFNNCYFDCNGLVDYIMYFERSNQGVSINYCTFYNITGKTITLQYPNMIIGFMPGNVISDFKYNWWGRNNPTISSPYGLTTIDASIFAVYNTTINPIGDGKFEVIGKLTWNDGTTEGIEKIHEMPVSLVSSTGTFSDSNPILKDGEFKVIYTSNSEDNEITATLDREVQKLNFKVVDVSASVENVDYGAFANVTVTVPSNINGNITVTVNNKTYSVKTTETAVNFIIDEILNPGNYTVDVVFIDEENELYGTDSTSFIVNKVEVSDDALDLSNIEGRTPSVSIELPKDATGNLTVTIGDDVFSKELVNGTACVEITGLIANDYDATVVYSGDDIYDSLTKDINVVIPKMDTKITIVGLSDGFNLTGVLKDVDGNVIANATIFYTIAGGDRLNTTTGEDGTFNVWAEDNSEIKFFFDGDDDSNPSNAAITLKNIKPTPKTTIIDVPTTMTKTAVDFNAGEKGTMFYFYLKDGDGKAVANKAVKIGIFDKIYTVKTDKNGRGGLQINIANANYYTYGISFLGDDDYKASFAVCSLQIVKKSVTITPAKTSYSFKTSAKTKTVTATLKSTNSYIPKGKQVTLTIAGKTFKTTIGAKGQISFNIGSITAKGTYKVAIKFAGTNTYAAATSKTITIKIA